MSQAQAGAPPTGSCHLMLWHLWGLELVTPPFNQHVNYMADTGLQQGVSLRLHIKISLIPHFQMMVKTLALLIRI